MSNRDAQRNVRAGLHGPNQVYPYGCIDDIIQGVWFKNTYIYSARLLAGLSPSWVVCPFEQYIAINSAPRLLQLALDHPCGGTHTRARGAKGDMANKLMTSFFPKHSDHDLAAFRSDILHSDTTNLTSK